MKTTVKSLITAIIAVIASFTFSLNVHAQISYSANGLSIQGAPKHAYLGMTIDKYLGMYWTCKGSNFFQLDISPENPRIAGTGDQIVFYNSATKTFNSIQVANVYNYSDARAKTNIQTLTTGMDKLLSLHPVSYNWKESALDKSLMKSRAAVAQNSPSSNVAYGPESDSNTQYGFLAQEVESVLPEAVHTDEEGHKMINYTSLIPMLVQAVQELEATVEKQSAVIAQLQNSLNGNNYAIKSTGNGKILNVTPNPATGNVSIDIEVPSNTSNVCVLISNLSGIKEYFKRIPKGCKNIVYDASSLSSGIHIVSLSVNGIIVDNHRLIRE